MGWRYQVEGRTDELWVRIDAAVWTGEGDGEPVLAWEVDLKVTGTLRSAAQRTLLRTRRRAGARSSEP